jgi:hypothetical protein
MERHEQLAGPRALTFGALAGFFSWGAIAIAIILARRFL